MEEIQCLKEGPEGEEEKTCARGSCGPVCILIPKLHSFRSLSRYYMVNNVIHRLGLSQASLICHFLELSRYITPMCMKSCAQITSTQKPKAAK